MLHPLYIDLLRQLIAIPSFSREEMQLADYLEQWLRAHGMQPRRVGNNLWVESMSAADAVERGCPTILLNAHIDTVRPAAGYSRDPFEPTIDGDIVYGLGSNDDLGSLIALLAAYQHITSQPLTSYTLPLTSIGSPARIIFSATAEEEVSGRGGIEMILPELGKMDLVIVGEPTQMQMAVAEKGLMVLDCTAHGKAGHAARNEGVNALYKAIDDINILRNYHFEKVSPFLGEVKLTTTIIEAGQQHNQIPDTCHFVVDVRGNGLYQNQEILTQIKQLISSEVHERSTRLNSSHIDTNHPIVLKAKDLGIEIFGSPTLSNQSLLTCPSVKIGPGDSARSHSADEFIRLSEIEEAITIYRQLI